MAITGTTGGDSISPAGASPGVTGGPVTSGPDSIVGLGGNDTLDGGSGDDTLDGGDGDDMLVGGAGNDSLVGGTGADAADYGLSPGGVVADLSTGTATDGFGTSDVLVGIERIWGSQGADSLTGATIAAANGYYGLFGGGGNDTINGLGLLWNNADHYGENGVVRINLSTGALIMGGMLVAASSGLDATGGVNTFQNVVAASGSNIGNDIIQGGDAAEWLIGNGGNDSIDGGAGNDTISGGFGDDVLAGGEGNDSAFGDAGEDTLSGDNGNDSLYGQDGNDSLIGGDGADFLDGGTGRDTLRGGTGNDTLSVGAASESNEYLFGEADNDELRGRTTASANGLYIFIDGGTGNDTIRGYGQYENVADYSARGAITATLGASGSVSLAGGEVDTLDTVRNIRGSAQVDVITGSSAAERFILGTGGADTVDGGSGTDRVDYIDFRRAPGETTGMGVFVNLAAGQATVAGAVQTLISIENLAGSDFDDTLIGSSGDNDIRPVAGNDVIDGGAGYDIVRYTTTGFIYAGVAQVGVVVNLTTGIGTDNWGFTDTYANIEAAYGSGLDDDLTGRVTSTGQFSLLRGLAGNDTLRGTDLDFGLLIVADYREDPNAVRVNLSGAAQMLGGLTVAGGTALDGYGGTDSFDKLHGILGSGGNDTIQGSDAPDKLYGWSGNDLLIGGAGNDTLGGGQGVDTYDGGDGFDLIAFTPLTGIDPALTQGVIASLLTGLIANDGYGNAESMLGGASNTIEMLIGGVLADDLTGRPNTSPGSFGTTGPGFLRGNQGNDTLRAAPADSRNVAVDHLRDADADGDGLGVTVDLVSQVATDGWGGTDTLVNIGAVRGSAFADSLIGNDGDNWFRAEAGNDTIIGGLGIDFISYTDSPGPVSINLATGTAQDGWGSTDLLSGIEQASGSETAGDTLIGSAAANLLYGYGGDDSLEGGQGNDTLAGHTGNDTLDGGAGLDSLVGGTGDDLYIVDNAGDTVAELAGEGTDTVQAGISWTLGDNLEALVLTGKAKTGTGNALENFIAGTGARNVLNGGDGNDTLEGGAGADQLDGGTGADSLVGGANNDTYLVDNAGDVIVELAGGGSDTVRASISWTLGDQLEDLVLLSGAASGTGNALNNVIEGNGAANLLQGFGGRDLLLGNAGNDTLLGGDGLDTLEGGGGRDSMDGGNNADLFRWALAAHGRDTINGFNPAQDDLAFSASGFGGGLVAGVALIAPGQPGAQFETNTTGAASTAAVRFVYNTDSGELFYDADGSGAGGPALIASFVGKPMLTVTDFIITA